MVITTEDKILIIALRREKGNWARN